MSKQLVWVDLPIRQPKGHEQHGRRPCVLVFDPATVQAQRFPMVLIIPITASFEADPPLYLPLPAGSGGLRDNSIVLMDQLGYVDASRVEGYLGTLTEAEYQPIHDVLRRMLEA